MRLQINVLLMAILMSLTQVVVAEDDSDATMDTVRQEMQSLREALENSDSERRDGLMDDIEDVMGVVDDRVMTLDNRLKDNWETADRLARVQAQTAVASMRRERARVVQWHDRMKDSSDATWGSMKDGFDEAFTDLSDAWQEAEENVRKAVEED